MPARNPPSASDRPAAWVAHADARTTRNTVSENSSGERNDAIAWNSGRSSQRPAANTSISASAAMATSTAIARALPVWPPPRSADSRASSSVNARSWNRQIATASRPCVRLFSDCSVSCATMIAVEDIATAPPTTTATAGAMRYAATAIAATMPAVSTVCAPPTPSTSPRIATNLGRENSRPRVNTRKTTPKSASRRVVSVSAASASAFGPSSMPTTR